MAMEIAANANIVEMEYAVRGPIPRRAAELAAQGRKTILCNIGNPQSLGQRPLSYVRKTLALIERPELIGRERRLRAAVEAGAVPGVGPDEMMSDHIMAAAEAIVAGFRHGVGAYTESAGARFIRQSVADFINRRDGFHPGGALAANPDLIFLGNGASDGVKQVIELLVGGPSDGVMIPIPQYPLYSAAIRKCGGAQVNYYPDEERGWTFSRAELEDAHAAAAAKGVAVKAIVVINPGNPTGSVLDAATIESVIEFALDKRVAIIADEVYQDNTYNNEFISFAAALGARDLPLFSLHSASKSFFGECGHRGGYMELRNPFNIAGTKLNAAEIILKQASVNLCSNTVGQAMVQLMVSPPTPDDGDHLGYILERDAILKDLHEKATIIRQAFQRMDGVACFGEPGAMYLFPRLGKLPPDTGDFEYCMALLEETGLCTVNGAGFGQKPGTSHLRIAFLPPKEMLAEVLPRWVDFHNRYVNR